MHEQARVVVKILVQGPEDEWKYGQPGQPGEVEVEGELAAPFALCAAIQILGQAVNDWFSDFIMANAGR